MIKKNVNHFKAIYVVTIISILFTASSLRAEERPAASKTLSETTKEFLSDRARTGSLLGSILVGAAVPNPLSPLLGSLAGFLIGKRSAYTNKDSNASQRQAANNRSLIPEDHSQVTSLAGLTGKQPQALEQTVMLELSEETETGYQSEQNEQIVIVGNTPTVSATRSLSGKAGTAYQPEQNEQIVIVGSTPMVSAVRTLSRKTDTGYQSQQTEQIVTAGNTSISSAIRLLSGETGPVNNLQQQLAYACSNVQLTQSMSLGCYYHSQ
ncbi:MAG: hypothetical protein ACI9UN_003340 [Granulosicoccus sp.]|jgi:hypothetical protein